jgi:undecaprenyl-diphosphatase
MNELWQRFELLSGEWRLCRACNRWAAGSSLVTFFRAISRLGDGVFWYVLMLALALFGGERGRSAALHMAAVGVVAATLYRLLKGWTRRSRPFRSHAGIVAHIAPLDEYSFPSGHTLHAVSFSLVALAWVPQLQALLLPLTVLIALSRVVLGLHYPSDVLMASLLGVGLAELSMIVVF